MKHKAQQFEIRWTTPEPFALAVEEAPDVQREVWEQSRRVADQRHYEARQEWFAAQEGRL